MNDISDATRRSRLCEQAFRELVGRFEAVDAKARSRDSPPFAYVVGWKEVAYLIMAAEHLGARFPASLDTGSSFMGKKLLFAEVDTTLLPVWEKP
jgi:hypothetical protein